MSWVAKFCSTGYGRIVSYFYYVPGVWRNEHLPVHFLLLSSVNAQSSNPSHFCCTCGLWDRSASLSRGRLTHPAAHVALMVSGGSSGGQATAARSSREGAAAASGFQLANFRSATRRVPPTGLYYNPQPTPPPAQAHFLPRIPRNLALGRLPAAASRSAPCGLGAGLKEATHATLNVGAHSHKGRLLHSACAQGQPRGPYFR